MITGSYGVLLTLFLEDGRVDFEGVERQIDELCNTSIDGIVACGSTSEFLFCKPEDNMEIMKIAQRVSGGRKDIIGGASSAGSGMTMEYLEFMSRVGMKTALVSPPYYYNYRDTEISAFYEEVAANPFGIGIIAYNIPFFTNSITGDVYHSLLQNPNIVAIKNSGQNIKEISNQIQIKNSVRADFSVVVGTEEAFLPCLAAGCDGAFTAFGTLLPDYIKAIYCTFKAGQYQLCKGLQSTVLPLMRLCGSETFPIGYKLFNEVLGKKQSHIVQSVDAKFRDKAAVLKADMEREYQKVLDFWNQNKEGIEIARRHADQERSERK